jgi:glycine dehydrogenase subunit 2
MGYHQATYDERLLSEIGSGNTYSVEKTNRPEIPDGIRRKKLSLPDVAEYDVIRHYVHLSQMNYSVDTGFYPLGSCTMKYNPKFADRMASDQRFSRMHPLTAPEYAQGELQVMYELQEFLRASSGMDAVTLQPLAGAQGEYTSMLIVRKYMESIGESRRNEIIIPDSAHGTNPASAAMAGFSTVEIPSKQDGKVDLDALRDAISDRTAAFMITNPSTLGVFESNILEIEKIVHGAGALLYYDGANFNAILGVTAPGLMGFDMVHFNLHKTFATPHGGGGPGAGPVAVKEKLREFLPLPVVVKEGKKYSLYYGYRNSIGRVGGFNGSFINLLRAWAYMKFKGDDGLTENTKKAVLNANYIGRKLEGILDIPAKGLKKHEVVASTRNTGKKALDVAKYIINSGVHAPTIYFPLIVPEALMIEPTEDASIEDMDNFVRLVEEAIKIPDEELHRMPVNLSIGRADEVRAARAMKLHW